LEPKHDTLWENLLDGFSGSLGTTIPLSNPDFAKISDGARQGTQQAGTPTLDLTLRYQPLGYWFATTTLHRYLDRGDQAPWNPDFTYGFGYDDWHPYTLNLTYGNYTNNRFTPSGKDNEQFTRFSQGTWQLGWKFPVPRVLAEHMLVDLDQNINCLVAANVTPSYYDLQANQNRDWKNTASFGCSYPIWGGWYANFTLFAYEQDAKQQPWDPDFTYGFGYFDWHPGTLTVQYNNYSGNRFPWRHEGQSEGGFTDGQVMVAWSFAF
jgi:hypothetical protein